MGQSVDDAVFNIALFFLVMVATLAALDITSPWVVLWCWVIYVTLGLVVASLLPREQENQRATPLRKRSSDRVPVPHLPPRPGNRSRNKNATERPRSARPQRGG